MKELRIQALLGAEWVDIAKLKILVPELGASSQCELAYQLKYAIQHDDEVDEHACGLALPVQILHEHLEPLADSTHQESLPYLVQIC